MNLMNSSDVFQDDFSELLSLLPPQFDLNDWLQKECLNLSELPDCESLEAELNSTLRRKPTRRNLHLPPINTNIDNYREIPSAFSSLNSSQYYSARSELPSAAISYHHLDGPVQTFSNMTLKSPFHQRPYSSLSQASTTLDTSHFDLPLKMHSPFDAKFDSGDNLMDWNLDGVNHPTARHASNLFTSFDFPGAIPTPPLFGNDEPEPSKESKLFVFVNEGLSPSKDSTDSESPKKRGRPTIEKTIATPMRSSKRSLVPTSDSNPNKMWLLPSVGPRNLRVQFTNLEYQTAFNLFKHDQDGEKMRKPKELAVEFQRELDHTVYQNYLDRAREEIKLARP